jgi:phosphonate dehydrogenase
MAKPKIIITNRVHDDVIDLLRAHCDVVPNQQAEPWSCDQLLIKAKDAVGILAFMTDRIDSTFLAGCPSLRIIAGVLKGFDNFDVEACTQHGVWFTVVSDELTAATAELTIGLMLGISRHIALGDSYARREYKGWRPILYGQGIEHSTVGLLGMGALGRALAKRLKPFGCTMLYFDEKPIAPRQAATLGVRFTSFDELLRLSEFLVIAVPLNGRTQHLINAGTVRQMKVGCYLINTARGSIVDEQAVAEALNRKHLGGYAADVFEMEDLARNDRPSAISPLLIANRNQTLLTPHLGSAERRVRRLAEIEMAHSVLDYLSGRIPRGAVNSPLAITSESHAKSQPA